jgi:hypothetical protein
LGKGNEECNNNKNVFIFYYFLKVLVIGAFWGHSCAILFNVSKEIADFRFYALTN